MISFSRYIIEADERGYIEYINVSEELHKFIQIMHPQYRRISKELMNMTSKLLAGESLRSVFSVYDNYVKKMQDFIKTVNRNDRTEIIIAAETGKYDIKAYEKMKGNFTNLENMYNQILNVVKIGDDMETACYKLEKLSNSLKYFNVLTGEYESNYFKRASRQDLLQKAKETGQCKLVGVQHLIVAFKNNKVIKAGF